MIWLLATLAIALGVVLVVGIWRRARDGYVPVPRREAWESSGPLGQVLRLDLDVTDRDDPAVQRLAQDAARRSLQADATLDHVEVRDRGGQVVLVEQRRPPHREITLPETLMEPRAPSRHGPAPGGSGGTTADHPRTIPEPPPTVPEVPLADRLDLPEQVRARVDDPRYPVDVVRAILLAAGREATVDGDLIRSGDVAIVVVDPRRNAEWALTHGYLRIEETDATRGLVLRTGYADPRIVRRREASAPHVRHVGPDALQRMADAVAVGADPLAFAAGPIAHAAPGTSHAASGTTTGPPAAG